MDTSAYVRLESLDNWLLEWARELHNDPDVLSVLTDPHVVSYEEQRVWFSKLQSSPTSQRLVVFDRADTPVGLVRIDSIDRHNKSVCVGLDIHRDFRGKGLAKLVYAEVLRTWFVTEGFNRVWLTVASYNERAICLYKKLGFREEGVAREALLKNGVFYDEVHMALLRSEYEAGF